MVQTAGNLFHLQQLPHVARPVVPEDPVERGGTSDIAHAPVVDHLPGDLVAHAVEKAEFVPQWFDVDAGRVVNLSRAPVRGARTRAVLDRIREVVLSRGAVDDGLVMGE